MPTMTQREIVEEFESRHGKGATPPESGYVYYASGGVREHSGAVREPEEFNAYELAKNKRRYWLAYIGRRERAQSDLRQTILSCAECLEKTGQAPSCEREEAELKQVNKEIRAANRSLAAVEEEVEAAKPSGLKRTVSASSINEAGRLRSLLKRDRA